MIRGLKVAGIWLDEALSIDPVSHVADSMRYATNVLLGRKTIDPKQLACRYCGAQPGANCTKWRRTKRGKVKQARSPHPDRVYDTKLANQMFDALTK